MHVLGSVLVYLHDSAYSLCTCINKSWGLILYKLNAAFALKMLAVELQSKAAKIDEDEATQLMIVIHHVLLCNKTCSRPTGTCTCTKRRIIKRINDARCQAAATALA